MSPLIPPDQPVDGCHAHQVEELIAGCETVGRPQEVCLQGVVVQLDRFKVHLDSGCLDHLPEYCTVLYYVYYTELY